MDFNKDFARYFVGYDKLLAGITSIAEDSVKMAQNLKYPPFNYKKVDDNTYVVEMAVAGFGRNDLEITLDGSSLIVKGNTQLGDEANAEGVYPTYFHQGLAMRPFTRYFTLGDHVEIKNAKLVNGILRIALEAIVPEAPKPTKVDITEED